jgi:hypothetical protein
MANRSDFNSVLPRQLKRLISLGVATGNIDPKHERTVRKVFIDAHAHAKRVRNSRTSLITNRDLDDSADAA